MGRNMGETSKDKAWLQVQTVISNMTDGASVQNILDQLNDSTPRRTLQHWLKQWTDNGLLLRTGEKRSVRYTLASSDNGPSAQVQTEEMQTQDFPYTDATQKALSDIRQPIIRRTPVGYNFALLNSYRPNETTYLTTKEKAHLAQLNQTMGEQPAGTYARQLLNRLLIDLSWNSSRLEGNTYSLLDTKRLIAFGAEAEGKATLEAQMIINHKDAIEFLVESAQDISFNRYTVLNLHGLLSHNLLPDSQASGRLREMSIGIGHSTFLPLDVPQLIQEYFDQLLQTAQAIHNPFEQAFFILVQLPYLQPFDDVNKRVSRLAANIPFIKHNLIPLAFTDLPQPVYIEAMLAVYELNELNPLKEVFIWAYERSASHYKAVQQTLGEPDRFRLKYREEMKTVVTNIVSTALNKTAAYDFLKQWTAQHLPKEDQQEFRIKTENELLGLHAGNFARYRIKPKTFDAWQAVW